MSTVRKSSTFGIIAIIVSVFLFFTPRLLISLGLMVWATFMIIGFIRDGNKVFAAVSLLSGGLIVFFLFREAVHSVEEYDVEYLVSCRECDIRYTNPTGGTDVVEKWSGDWRHRIACKGDVFLSLQAQNGDTYSEVKSTIRINGKLLETKTSAGSYQIADVHGRPEEIHNKVATE